MDDTCIMCAIADEQAPARLLYRDEHACSFLDIEPVRDGHALVIPRRHVSDIVDPLAASVLAEMATALQTTAHLLTDRLGADGLSVFQSNGSVAGQTIFHLHIHLVPRIAGDQRLTNWSPDQDARLRIDQTYRSLTRTT